MNEGLLLFFVLALTSGLVFLLTRPTTFLDNFNLQTATLVALIYSTLTLVGLLTGLVVGFSRIEFSTGLAESLFLRWFAFKHLSKSNPVF
jgi:hypothetical protein